MKIAFLFPGQGSQCVGMGIGIRNHPAAKRIFEQANDTLSFSLTNLMWEGPENLLMQTAYTQPALLTHSIAAHAILQDICEIRPDYLAGHSLGEYSACVIAGVLSFEDALRTVHFRGQAMQRAVAVGIGAMAAVLGGDIALIRDLCEKINLNSSHYVHIANFNGPAQTVLAGRSESVQLAIDLLKEQSVRVIPLKVSAPFHCALMQPAQDEMHDYLQAVSFANAKIPLFSNVSAEILEKGEQIRDALVRQISSSVRFTQILESLNQVGVSRFAEIGSGSVLLGIVKRMRKDALLFAVGDDKQAQDFVQGLKHVA